MLLLWSVVASSAARRKNHILGYNKMEDENHYNNKYNKNINYFASSIDCIIPLKMGKTFDSEIS